MFAKELKQAGHTKRFTISQAGAEGWEVCAQTCSGHLVMKRAVGRG